MLKYLIALLVALSLSAAAFTSSADAALRPCPLRGPVGSYPVMYWEITWNGSQCVYYVVAPGYDLNYAMRGYGAP